MSLKRISKYIKLNCVVEKIINCLYTRSQIETYIWNEARKIMPYVSCEMEKGKYVFFFDKCDAGISNIMFQTKKVYAKKELELFFRLTKQYYGYTPNEEKDRNIFLDIGGNIGTMSIMAKKIYSSLDVIGFEPASENVKLFKINTIANDVDDIHVINMALSDFDGTAKLFLNKNSCTEHILMMDKYRDISKRDGAEQVEVMKLDSWFEKSGLPLNKVGYICLDVEGHEDAVLRGARQLLSDHAIPIWLEISSEQHKNDTIDSLIDNVSKYYNFYIDKRKPHIIKKICELKELTEEFISSNSHTDIFLIK